MFSTKIPKSCAPDKKDFFLLNKGHTPKKIANDLKHVRIISIDPAIKNIGIRIETRYDADMIVTEFMDKISIGTDEESFYIECNKFFDTLCDLISTCHIIIIERQLPVNYKPVRISQHIITYFMVKYSHLYVIELDSKIKSRMLANKKMNKHELKKWSVELGIKILRERNDNKGLEIVEKFKKMKKKLDDIMDTVIQIEGFLKLDNELVKKIINYQL